jgi:hypothetical protein
MMQTLTYAKPYRIGKAAVAKGEDWGASILAIRRRHPTVVQGNSELWPRKV